MQVNRFAKFDSCQIVKDNLSSIKTQEEKNMLLEFRESHLNQQKYVLLFNETIFYRRNPIKIQIN